MSRPLKGTVGELGARWLAANGHVKATTDATRRVTWSAHVTPHDLRHTAASPAISAGANPKAVQKMLGHAKASMTLDVYADLFEDDLEAVAEALDVAVRAAE